MAAWVLQGTRLACPLVLFILIRFGAAGSEARQTKTDGSTTKGASSSDKKASKKTEKQSTSDLSSKSITPKSQETSRVQVGGEYVSCKFTEEELRSLKTPSVAQTITAAESEQLKQSVIATASSPATLSELGPEGFSSFVAAVSGRNYEGITASQALNKVIEQLKEEKGKKAGPQDIEFLKKQLLTLGAVKEKEANEKGKDAKIAMSNFLDAELGDGKCTQNCPTLAQLKRDLIAPLIIFVQTDASQKDTNLPSLIAFLQVTPLSAVSAIVGSAREALAIMQRPDDIGCAMSILDYPETDHAYGFLIAREYIAVQVVVRNLNASQPFVLHDVEFGIDTGGN